MYHHQIPVTGNGNCYIAFKDSAWGGGTITMKPGWWTAGGRSRPGAEMWPEFFLQAITEAIRVGFVTDKQALQAVLDGMP